MKVELSQTEYMLATQIGMMRHQMNRAAGVKSIDNEKPRERGFF